jgi:molybdopterin/thiamine biosynthesis adenylyltransferase
MNRWLDEHIRTLTSLCAIDPSQARALFGKSLHVSLDPQLRGNRTYRLAFQFAVTLLARLFPNISFDDIGPMPYLILPWGDEQPESHHAENPGLILLFGKASRVCPSPQVTANCQDWLVYIDLPIEPNPDEPWNPVLALVTACYAAARATKVLLGGAVRGADRWKPFSIIDFREGRAEFDWDEAIDSGPLHFAAIGAVTNAALYALGAHKGVTGDLTLVDHDTVEDGNLGRYALFDNGDVGALKVEAAERRLRELGLMNVLDTVPSRFEEFFDRTYAEDPTFRVHRLVSAPDRRSTRRHFQSKLPRQLYDASTGPDQVILHNNSFERERACLACIYPDTPEEDAHLHHVADALNLPFDRVASGEAISPQDAQRISERYPEIRAGEIVGKAFDSVFKQLCSAGQLRAGSQVVLAPFPFISGLAGVLLYFELVKSLRPQVFPDFRDHNYAQLNPFFPPNPDFREQRPSRPDCFCQREATRRLFCKIWGSEAPRSELAAPDVLGYRHAPGAARSAARNRRTGRRA